MLHVYVSLLLVGNSILFFIGGFDFILVLKFRVYFNFKVK